MIALVLAEPHGSVDDASMRTLLAALLLLVSVTACPGPEEPEPPKVEYPEWVTMGSRLANGDGKRVVYGVGAASGIKNVALARATADNRARAEIAKTFEVEVKIEGDRTKTWAAQTLNGVEIVDHWIHPKDGTIYALARVEVTPPAVKAP